jgi:hypothetical protein
MQGQLANSTHATREWISSKKNTKKLKRIIIYLNHK